ncbi:MAG: transposase [Thermoanaerobaculales bacterium]
MTVCTADRRNRLGEIADGCVRLWTDGRIVAEEWTRSAVLRPNLNLEAFVVMPNHLHGIVWLTGGAGATRRVAPGRGSASPLRSGASPGSVGAIIGQFKAAAARRINALRGTPGRSFWQRGFYERVVRNDTELAAMRTYIANNPLQWALDRENPEHDEHRDVGTTRRIAPGRGSASPLHGDADGAEAEDPQEDSWHGC